MKRTRRTIAAILAAVLTYGVFFGTMTPSFAAVSPVNIYVDNYSGGKLDFHWDQLPGVAAAVITYHVPDNSNVGTLQTITLKQTTNSGSVSGLKSDYIYDLNIALYDTVDAGGNPTGSPIGLGLLYYLPKMTFFSDAPSQPYDDITGGGRESGRTPKLKLRWRIPRVWSAASHNFELSDSALMLTQMQNALNAVYNDGRVLSTLNFRINISTDLRLLNSGSSQSTVIVDSNAGGGYVAKVSGGTVTAAVTAVDANDYISFELWGRSDINATVPIELDSAKPGFNPNALPDNDLLPGSVYYMNIKPIYMNAAKANVAAVAACNPTDFNGSLLSGPVPYAYTPIRFQLTKDSANNIYVKIYKINQGSLDLPRLFYEVQASDDPSIAGDWAVKKTMDDSYFSGDYAVTVISGVNPNNQVYYKIVVKSDSQNDRLESLKLPYTLIVDTSRPPLPTNIAITNRVLNSACSVPIPDPNDSTKIATLNIKSTDVTISWDKPLGWDDTMAKNLSYHFLISTSQTDLNTSDWLYSDGTITDSGGNKTPGARVLLGQFTPKFRLVKYIYAYNATNDNTKIISSGSKLYYTLKASDLFTWEKYDKITDITSSGSITNADGYPNVLLPNTVYYLQMYTTKADDAGTQIADRMSDKSIVTSFTTLNGVELDVPLPMSFGIDGNGKDTSVVPPVNYVDLTFDKVTNLDWNNYTNIYDQALYNYDTYYDIFMNSRTDTAFTLIGSTDNQHGDIVFTGANDPASTSIKARVSTFAAPALSAIFGNRLLPNTTYYFKVRTRLVITKKSDNTKLVPDKASIDTAILPVTTIVLDIKPPDDSKRKPLAPTDFAIAEDANGDQLLSGSSVTFTWQRQENDVIYQLIRTGQKTSPTDTITAYQSDPEYTSFLPAYDQLSDGSVNQFIYLDPAPGTGYKSDPGKFNYDPATRICTYTVDRRLFPNKLYYFSLKAVRVTRNPIGTGYTTGEGSVWVSIPVTTSLIQPPVGLEAVNAAELGFYWDDNAPGMTAEDFIIYARGPGDSDYKLMTRSQSTVVKDKDGRTYFGRLLNLKANSSYDIRVFKGAGSSGTLVYDKRDLQTRDGFHQLEIKWIGQAVDDLSRYEIAIMAEGSSSYTILSGNDLEYYSDKNGSLIPYYTEETPLTVNNDSLYFHARIKEAEVVLPGGLVTHQPLRSNVKYYIKVRAVKVDSTDQALISFSKYIGPVDSRTEFNQDDYDNTDREEKQKAIFLDRMKQLEQGYYWRIAVGNSSADRILLKGERVVNALGSMAGDTFTVDLTAINANIDRDEVYVPVSVIRAMNSRNKSLLIKTPGAEYLLRPDTLDASENKQINELLAKAAVKDLYLRLIAARTDTVPSGFPVTGERVSRINDLEVQAIGSSKSEGELKKLFDDKLYNKDSGLVGDKLNILQNTYLGTGSNASKLMEEYTSRLVDMIESELSSYVDNTIESIKLASATQNIIEFSSPLSASLSCNDRQGTKIPYVLYDGTSAWQKILNGTRQAGGVTMNVLKTGKYAVILVQGTTKDIPDGYWAKDYISRLTSKYDLSDVFSGIGTSFMPDNKVTCKEVILLFEKVTGRSATNAGLDPKQKSAKLGLDGIISPNGILKNVRRQETAAVLMQLFGAKKGIDAGSLRPGGNINIEDEADIDSAYYNSVLMIVDLGVMSIDSEGRFAPAANMTRAEVSVAFVRLLELTGDM